jgi:hypothetical protein
MKLSELYVSYDLSQTALTFITEPSLLCEEGVNNLGAMRKFTFVIRSLEGTLSWEHCLYLVFSFFLYSNSQI